MSFLPEKCAQWLLVPVLLVIIVGGFLVGIGNEYTRKLEPLIRARIVLVKRNMKNMEKPLAAWTLRHHKTYPGRPHWAALSTSVSIDLGVDPAIGADPFPSDLASPRLQLYSNGSDFLALISRGPDGELELTSETLGKAAGLESPLERMTLLVPFCYDPSNGTVSTGDIWRLMD